MEDKLSGEYFNADHTLRSEKVEDLLVEVCSGKYIYSSAGDGSMLYASRTPTMQEQDKGRIMYTMRLHEAKARGCNTRQELEAVGLEKGLISPEKRQEKEEIHRQLERYRKIRDNTPSSQQKLEIDQQTFTMREKLMRIEQDEHVLLQHSADAHAEDARLSYYIGCCTLGGRMLDEQVWPTFEDFENETDSTLIALARSGYFRVSIGLPTKLIRALARSPAWRNRWQAISESGATPFDGTSSAWDQNKLNLIYWSKFYENVHAHPEAPDEVIINDDDRLQEWIGQQLAKRNQTKPVGVSQRPSPTYIQGGQRKKMTKIGSDTVIKVNQPYRLRTSAPE